MTKSYGVYTYTYPLPGSIRAFTVNNNDDTYTIVINDSLSRECQLKAYQHEIEHIENGDFDSELTADEIEHNAHRAL